MTTFNTVLTSVRTVYQRDTALAAGKDILPGMICEFAGTTTETIQPHSTDTAIPTSKIVAIESAWRLGADLNTEYDQDGELVAYQHLSAGDHFYALLAPGEIVDSLADRLGSNGDGALKIATTYAFLRPLELVDNTYGASNVRIHVEVLG